MNNGITPALQSVLDLFESKQTWTNRQIADELHISYKAAYARTYRLRRAGLLESGMMWKTCDGGKFAWTDEHGHYRSWCELWLSNNPDEPDTTWPWFVNKKYRREPNE